MTRIFKEVAPWIPEPTSTRFIPYEHHAFWKLKTGGTVRLIVRRRNGWTKVLWALDGYEFFKTKRTFCNTLTEDEAKEILLTGNHWIREMYREMSD